MTMIFHIFKITFILAIFILALYKSWKISFASTVNIFMAMNSYLGVMLIQRHCREHVMCTYFSLTVKHSLQILGIAKMMYTYLITWRHTLHLIRNQHILFCNLIKAFLLTVRCLNVFPVFRIHCVIVTFYFN